MLRIKDTNLVYVLESVLLPFYRFGWLLIIYQNHNYISHCQLNTSYWQASELSIKQAAMAFFCWYMCQKARVRHPAVVWDNISKQRQLFSNRSAYHTFVASCRVSRRFIFKNGRRVSADARASLWVIINVNVHCYSSCTCLYGNSTERGCYLCWYWWGEWLMCCQNVKRTSALFSANSFSLCSISIRHTYQNLYVTRVF